MNVKKVLMETFIGPPETGVYSPYVQRTLYLMGSAVLRRFADVSSIHLKMPNIHFLPVNLSTKENPSMVKIPYQTNKATLVQKIAKLVENKTLEGIGDMRDESDRNGMRVVNEGSLAAKRALKLVGSKSVLKSSLYGKRADCSSTNPEESEIFIVNGNFAGGSAKQGRDRRFQAILPLNGKILNTERKDEAAMYKNEDIQNLILGLGLGVNGEDFKMENLRYHKIIILTDADVDGAYRRALLLTFFFRYQRALFDAGCIYLGEPPVYKVERGKHAQYCYDEAELEKIISTFPTNTSFNTRRFKGLGEMMPIELWETTMNPETRMIKQLFIGDTTEANMTFSSLMGTRVDVWREVVTNAASRINLETLDI